MGISFRDLLKHYALWRSIKVKKAVVPLKFNRGLCCGRLFLFAGTLMMFIQIFNSILTHFFQYGNVDVG